MTPQRARELLDASVGRRLLLVGDLMMDEWVFGSVGRISPEAPIPVVTMPLTPDARAHKPGGAGNAAAVLLALGAKVRAVGVVGADDHGRRLVAELERRGAEVSGVLTDSSRPTTHKLRIIAARQQLLRVDTESGDALDAALAERLRREIERALGEVDGLLAADYAKGVLSAVSLPAELMAEVRNAALPFCADPKPINVELFRGASLVCPNEPEALQAAGPNAHSAAWEAFCEAGEDERHALPPAVLRAGWGLRQRLGAEAVFITRGDRGIAVFESEREAADVPALVGSGEVGDGTGCGDAVSATSALALAGGASYLEAAELANAAGGVVSRFVGVHSPTADEIVDWLRRAG